MTTATLDTNVLASGIVGYERPESTPGAILRAWHEQRFQVALSLPILDELRDTLQKPYFASRIPARLVARAEDLLRTAVVTELTVTVHGVATHPEDDLVLATAVSARADYLVTGDRRLLDLGSHGGVAIVSPRDFLTVLEPAAEQ